MTIRYILQTLEQFDLNQMAIKNTPAQMITLLNLSLLHIYTEKNLIQSEQSITLHTGITHYSIQKNAAKILVAYRKYNGTLLLDTSLETTMDDSSLYAKNIVEVSINDENDPQSIFTPEPYRIEVKNPKDNEIIVLQLVLEPPVITDTNIDTIDFAVPPLLLEAITSYAAYRAYIAKNGYNDQSKVYWIRYMNAMMEAEAAGSLRTENYTNRKLEQKGFI